MATIPIPICGRQRGQMCSELGKQLVGILRPESFGRGVALLPCGHGIASIHRLQRIDLGEIVGMIAVLGVRVGKLFVIHGVLEN